jgi:hypothetical protein
MAYVGIFCGHLVYFVIIWCILWSFGILCSHLVHLVVISKIFRGFGMSYHEKSGNPEVTCSASYVCQRRRSYGLKTHVMQDRASPYIDIALKVCVRIKWTVCTKNAFLSRIG